MESLLLLVALGCAGAPASDASDDGEPSGASIQEVRSAIDEAIESANAASLEQCRLLALGEKPCGGPRLYRAYSVAETDSAALAELARTYDRLDRERNVEEGLVSTCVVLPEPDLALRDGRCVTVSER